MAVAVDQALSGCLVLTPHLHQEIRANLRYLRDDPFAVHLAFPAAAGLAGEQVEWVFARDLLDDGIYEPSGDGDIHLWPCAPGLVMIEFDSPHGMALVEFAAADLNAFLDGAYEAVPAGEEVCYLDLDAELATLLGR